MYLSSIEFCKKIDSKKYDLNVTRKGPVLYNINVFRPVAEKRENFGGKNFKYSRRLNSNFHRLITVKFILKIWLENEEFNEELYWKLCILMSTITHSTQANKQERLLTILMKNKSFYSFKETLKYKSSTTTFVNITLSFISPIKNYNLILKQKFTAKNRTFFLAQKKKYLLSIIQLFQFFFYENMTHLIEKLKQNTDFWSNIKSRKLRRGVWMFNSAAPRDD